MISSATFGAGIDYVALLPVILVALGALGILIADLFLGEQRKPLLNWAACGVLCAALAAELGLWFTRTAQARTTFCVPVPNHPTLSTGLCSYSVDNFSLTLQTVALGGTILVVLMSSRLRQKHSGHSVFGEYHFLILCSLTGALLMAAARDFITMTVALETLSLPAFALVGFGKRAGGEAALKFFLMSVTSTAVMLFGISLVYGVTGSVYFTGINRALSGGPRLPVLAVGIVLTLAGFAFKVSAVPFHFWTPEVYAGAPLPIAAYLSVVSKTAGFAGLILSVETAFSSYLSSVAVLIAVLAALTMTVGNLVALRQSSVVRLLAWSSIGQAGYILVPLSVTGTLHSSAAVGASVGYLVLYAVMNLGAFAIVNLLSVGEGTSHSLADYRGLFRTRPRVALPLAFFLLCLAGLPPGLMGLFAKVAVIRAVIDGGPLWLAVIVAVNIVIGLFYYLRWIALLVTPTPQRASQTGAESETLPQTLPGGLSTTGPIRWTATPLALRLAVLLPFLGAIFFSLYPDPALWLTF
jgi:NADH-quinone oxidoreductase subunit N